MARSKSLLDFDQFLRGVRKGAIAPVYAFIGSEPYLQDRGLAAVRERLEADVGDDLDIVSYDAKEDEATGKPPEIGAILDDFRMASLFGGRRLIQVKNAGALLTANGELLERTLAAPRTENVLVCQASSLRANAKAFKAIAAAGQTIDCDPPYSSPPPWKPNAPAHDTPLAHWVVERARELDLQLGLQEARLLYDIAGTSLHELSNELDKIRQSQGPGRVSSETIEQLVARSGEGSAFVLAEAVGEKDLPRAVEICRRLFEGGVHLDGRSVLDPGVIAGFLVSALHRMFVQIGRAHAILAAGGDDDDLGRELGVRSFFLPRLKGQMRRWSAVNAQAVLRRLFDVDRRLKSGSRQRPDEIIEEALVTWIGLTQVRSSR
ncbi:MAG: DNA polymerase III subunit delta [Planctomycetota bacterium]